MTLHDSPFYPLDNIDQRLLDTIRERIADPHRPLSIGDWIEYPDGSLARVAHIWTDGHVQPTPGALAGSFHAMTTGACSYSGALLPGIPDASLTRTTRTAPGPLWFAHHDKLTAGCHVDATADFPIYTTTENPQQ